MVGSRSVSRARARARAVRSAVARRRRRALALTACAATLVGLPIAWMIAEPAAVVAAAAASQVRDLAELFDQRSPGARTQAELTKHARALAKVRSTPKAPARAGVSPKPSGPVTTALVDLLQPPIAPVSVVAEALPPPLAPAPTLNAIMASAPGIQSFAPPADTPGPLSFPSSEPREPLPPTSAVPEPGTWALMLAGFGLIGWQLRGRRRCREDKVRRAAR